MERVMGIEPTTSAWKAEVLPVNYTRIFIFCQNYERSDLLHITRYSIISQGFP